MGKRKKAKRRQWPNVYSRTHRSGQVSYVVDLGLINGKRERHSFQTKDSATVFAEQKRTQRLNEGLTGVSLSPDVRHDAAKASAILQPHGISLLEAANYYVKHVLAYKDAPRLTDIVKKLIEDAERKKCRDRTVGELRSRLNRFAEDFPGRQLHDITVEELEDWLGEEGWSSRSKINYLTKISQLYNYAVLKKWADANLTDRIERPKTDDNEAGIFTLNAAARLLKHAGEHQLLPYVALGLFAGLRSAELMRINWEAVKVADKAIVVGAKVAKKRSRRVVEMSDTLYAWLKLCQKVNGPVVDVEHFRDNMEALRKAAGIEAWPHNGLRHSYGSYHLAAFGDQIKTAAQMGHRDSNVIHNHYKALVVKAEAEKFWTLAPHVVNEMLAADSGNNAGVDDQADRNRHAQSLVQPSLGAVSP
jgi:integrase